MKCERCGKELADIDLYCTRCGQAVFPQYMDEEEKWEFYKSDEELEQILKEEQEAAKNNTSEKENMSDEQILEKTESATVSESTAVKEAVVTEDAEKPGEVNEEKSDTAEITDEFEDIELDDEELEEVEMDDEGTEPELFEIPEEVTEPETIFEPETASESQEVQEPEEISEKEAEPENINEPEASDVEKPEVLTMPETEESEKSDKSLDVVKAKESDEKPRSFSEKEDKDEYEDDDDYEDDDEDDEDDEKPLTPERKKVRRRTVIISVLFLLICLGTGILLGINHMKKMEQKQKDYYNSLGEKDVKATSKNVENSEKPEANTEDSVDAAEKEDAEAQETQTPEQEEPKPEETEVKAEYFKLVNAEEIDFSQYKKIQPVSVEENSVKQSESYDYSAKKVIDGDVKSSWQEGEDGVGEGKGFKLNLDGNHKIRYIVLHLGNWRKDELWDFNARPHALTMQVGDSQEKEVEFPDEKKKFCLSFDEPLDASYVSMYIKSAYEGSRWDDNCISEVEIYE